MSSKIDKVNDNTLNELYNDLDPDDKAMIGYEVEIMKKVDALIDNVIEIREAKGLSQKQLAELAGLKQSAVARLESRRAIPRLSTLHRLLLTMGYKLVIVTDEITHTPK